MQSKRFTFLTRMVQFNDVETREKRCKEDTFVAFKELFEGVSCCFLKLRKPLLRNKTLNYYCGSKNFKHYNPSKPAKHGLLFRSLCKLTFQHTYVFLPPAGKPTVMPSKCYITGTKKYTGYLVNNVIEVDEVECVK